MTNNTQPASVTDLETLKSELQWCIAEGTYGPRTGAALRWALELIEELEVKARASHSKQ